MLKWLAQEINYQYFYVIYLKLKFLQYWQRLNKNSKTWIIISASGISTSLVCLLFRYFQMISQQNERLIKQDLNETKLLSKRRKKDFPPGLYNEGNTCFANCVIQAISSCEAFCKWVKKMTQSRNCTEVTVLPAINTMIRAMNNEAGNENCYSLADVFESLRSHGWVISAGQQDAYELFQIILTTIAEENSKVFSCTIPQQYKFLINNESQMSRLKKSEFSKISSWNNAHDNKSPFDVSYANKMICLTCGFQNAIKFESGDGLVLNIQTVNQYANVSLRCLLRKWMTPELVHHVHCKMCSEKAKTSKKSTFTKQVLFAKLPQCLCIQLQRTFYTNQGHVMKNSVHVNFPETLDMQEYTFVADLLQQNQKKSLHYDESKKARLLGGDSSSTTCHETKSCKMYQLKSVIAHYGYADDGHYVTYRLHNGKWYYTSDEKVHLVDVNKVRSANAYVLFYEKQI